MDGRLHRPRRRQLLTHRAEVRWTIGRRSPLLGSTKRCGWSLAGQRRAGAATVRLHRRGPGILGDDECPARATAALQPSDRAAAPAAYVRVCARTWSVYSWPTSGPMMTPRDGATT